MIALFVTPAASQRPQPTRSGAVPKTGPKQSSQSYDDEQIRKSIDAITAELRAIREQQAKAQEEAAKHQPDPGSPDYSNWALTLLAAIAAIYTAKAFRQQKRQADAAHKTLAINLRGYLQVGFGSAAQGDASTLFPIRLVGEGHTGVTIIDGSYVRLSIDEPPFPPQITQDDRTTPIPPRNISPKAKEIEIDVLFPALTAQQRETWSHGQLRTHLTGTIRYRDAFEGTPVHRKYFGVVSNIGSAWTLNPLVRNDEEDEDKGESGEYHRN